MLSFTVGRVAYVPIMSSEKEDEANLALAKLLVSCGSFWLSSIRLIKYTVIKLSYTMSTNGAPINTNLEQVYWNFTGAVIMLVGFGPYLVIYHR